MTRLTNIALFLVTLYAAVGCSAVVNNTLKMKDDAGPGDSGTTDSGVADTGPSFECTEADDPTAFCDVSACLEPGECAPEDPSADPDTGCVFGDAIEGTCNEFLPNSDTGEYNGMCVDGFCEGCGDGEVRGIEQCDDGNGVNGDGCNNNCRLTCAADADCNRDCTANRQCANVGDVSVCQYPPGPVPPLPNMEGDACALSGPTTMIAGMCVYGEGTPLAGRIELCCGMVPTMGGMPFCCGIFPGDAGPSCGPPPPELAGD